MESLIPSNGQVLRETQPAYPADGSQRFGPTIYPPLPTQDSALREYSRVLLKHKWTAISCLVVIFTLVAIATLRMTPIYDAMGRIAINKPDTSIINFRDNAVGVDYTDPVDLDTEVRVLQSDLLALEVMRKLNLDKRPDSGGLSSGPSEQAQNLELDPLQPNYRQITGQLVSFKAGLKVALIPNTRVMEIHYASPDPQLAASVVNTYANIYAENSFKTKFESTMQASDWLSKQLVDLQMKVETSQEKLVQYQKKHEILGTDEKQNIITEKLDELNKQLTAAESDRMQKESVYRLTQSGDPEALASGASASFSPETTGIDGGSSLLEKLRTQQADLKIQTAQLSTQFGPAYPKVAQLSNQLKETEVQIQNEQKKIASRLRNQYLAALQRENMLRAGFEKQKQEQNKLNESAIEYSLLKRDVDSNRQLYEGLLQKLKEAGVSAGLKSNNVKLIDPARVPTAPSEPNIPRNLAFALVLGLTTAIGSAFLLESLDNTVRTPEQAQLAAALPSLGMIPLGSKNMPDRGSRQLATAPSSKEAVELVTQVHPKSQMAEAYRALRTSLLLCSSGAPPKVILVTSALPQEGKTTTSINTAVVLAHKGVRVLLMDADLRRPGIHKILGLGPRIGLSNVLTGSADLQQVVTRSPLLPNLVILPAGTPPPNPAELLASPDMQDLIERLRDQYDHIVIDTPPALSVTDAVVLATRADAVVLVIRSGHTTKQALRRAREILGRVNAKVTGVLMNAVNLRSADYYYYSEYQGKYGGRYYVEDEVTDAEESAKASPGAD